MGDKKPSTAQQIAQAIMTFQRECTGRAPESVSVLLGGETLVVTLHEALSPAEKELARTPDGAAHVREFHRQLFQTSAGMLHLELKRILGIEIKEAAVEIEPATGRIVEVFPSGTLVQVFHLAQTVEMQTCKVTRTVNPFKAM